MKKLKTIFALALAVCLVVPAALALSACKTTKGDPKSIIGKTYKCTNVEVKWKSEEVKKNYLQESEITEKEFAASVDNTYGKMKLYFKSEIVVISYANDEDKGSPAFYKIFENRQMSFYKNEEMTKEILGESVVTFSKNYKKLVMVLNSSEDAPLGFVLTLKA